ncbi:hypothetical protein T484DRAFT_1839965 [Baffinella frigidus]|nr:hypothetical protein T484DRAFT_1839965 [Cryptophyta sp. CCMP2293]
MFDQLSTAYRVFAIDMPRQGTSSILKISSRFAIDMLGFGLSARPPFPDSPDGES